MSFLRCYGFHNVSGVVTENVGFGGEKVGVRLSREPLKQRGSLSVVEVFGREPFGIVTEPLLGLGTLCLNFFQLFYSAILMCLFHVM